MKALTTTFDIYDLFIKFGRDRKICELVSKFANIYDISEINIFL